jgi:hypothetical protein
MLQTPISLKSSLKLKPPRKRSNRYDRKQSSLFGSTISSSYLHDESEAEVGFESDSDSDLDTNHESIRRVNKEDQEYDIFLNFRDPNVEIEYVLDAKKKVK